MRRTKRWLAFLLSFSMMLGTGASPVFVAPSQDVQTAVESTVSAGTEAEGSAVSGSEEATKNQAANSEDSAGNEETGTAENPTDKAESSCRNHRNGGGESVCGTVRRDEFGGRGCRAEDTGWRKRGGRDPYATGGYKRE